MDAGLTNFTFFNLSTLFGATRSAFDSDYSKPTSQQSCFQFSVGAKSFKVQELMFLFFFVLKPKRVRTLKPHKQCLYLILRV